MTGADYVLFGYIGLLLIYLAAEIFLMRRAGTFRIKVRTELTYWLITVSFRLSIAGSLIEYVSMGRRPGHVSVILGVIFLCTGTAFRVMGQMHLQKWFTPVIAKAEGQQLVDTGLYKYIRHPLYVGSLFLFIASPTFLAARISWIFVFIGVAGIFVRIRREEKFLLKELDGYKEYMDRTSALIPGIF